MLFFLVYKNLCYLTFWLREVTIHLVLIIPYVIKW